MCTNYITIDDCKLNACSTSVIPYNFGGGRFIFMDERSLLVCGFNFCWCMWPWPLHLCNLLVLQVSLFVDFLRKPRKWASRKLSAVWYRLDITSRIIQLTIICIPSHAGAHAHGANLRFMCMPTGIYPKDCSSVILSHLVVTQF